MVHHRPDVARRAAEITGTPEALAARVIELMTGPTGETSIEQARRHLEQRAIQARLADEFGHRNGWRIGTDFTPSMLARRAMFPKRRELWYTASDAMDHPYFYRAARRAAGIVVHLYNCTSDVRHQAIAAWAMCQGLVAGFPTDFPSWWYPGATTLVVYEPKEAA